MHAANSAARRKDRIGQRRFRIRFPRPARLRRCATSSCPPCAPEAAAHLWFWPGPSSRTGRNRAPDKGRSRPAVADRVRMRPDREASSLRPGAQAGWPTKRRIAPGRATRAGSSVLSPASPPARRSREKQGRGALWARDSRLGGRLQRRLPEAPPAIDFRRCGSFS